MYSAYYTKLTNSIACNAYVHYFHSTDIKPSTSLRIQYTTVAKQRKLSFDGLLYTDSE